jgi:hypothetical protein
MNVARKYAHATASIQHVMDSSSSSYVCYGRMCEAINANADTKITILSAANEGNFPPCLFFIHYDAMKAVVSSAATHTATALNVSNISYTLGVFKRIVSYSHNFMCHKNVMDFIFISCSQHLYRLCGIVFLATGRRCIVFPVTDELNLYMLCRRK